MENFKGCFSRSNRSADFIVSLNENKGSVQEKWEMGNKK